MEISVFRIDDRLIHGQIITAWIAYADAKNIIVADDKAAVDEFQGEGKALLLMRGPVQALKFVEAGIRKDQINVGNMNMKKGKTKVLGNLWVFPEDVEAIKNIYAHDVKLEVRAVPNERSQDVMELLKKVKLA